MSKPKTAYIVVPQRRHASGWRTAATTPGATVETPQRFAVYREITSASRHRGLPVRARKFITEFSNRTLAEEDARRRTRLVNTSGTKRTLGQRFGAIGRVIAGSLNSPWAKNNKEQ